MGPNTMARPQRRRQLLAGALALCGMGAGAPQAAVAATTAVTGAEAGAAAPSQVAGSQAVLLAHAGGQLEVLVDGHGPALVLLPSSLRDATDLAPLAQRLAAQGFQVLRPQPRGMGRSSPPPPDMTLATLADDVALAVTRLADGPAVIVGHAYGHWVARVTDVQHPRVVRGVVLLAAGAAQFPSGLVEALAVASDPQQPEAKRLQALAFSMFAPGNDPRPWLDGWHPQWRDAYRRAALQPPRAVWASVAHAPMLDLQAADDAWRPAASRKQWQDLFGDRVTVEVIAGAGHALVPEQPDAVAAALVRWVRQLPPARTWAAATAPKP